MADSTRARMADRLRSVRDHESHMALLACMAVVVTAFVAISCMRYARAISHVETLLDCHYEGDAAHTHSADCYDKSGTLVCPLQEREVHVHDQSCYAETKTLVCGMKQGQKLKDGTVHRHTDDCYELASTLVCGLDEITEEHVHGPGCFVTAPDEQERIDVLKSSESADNDGWPAQATRQKDGAAETGSAAIQTGDRSEDADVTSPGMPAQVFEEELLDDNGSVLVRATVEAPEGAFPENTSMRVRLIDSDEARAIAKEAARKRTAGRVDQVQLLDITFFDEAGNEVEPLERVTVKLGSTLIEQSADPVVVQVENGDTGSVVETLDKHELELREDSTAADELAFDVSR